MKKNFISFAIFLLGTLLFANEPKTYFTLAGNYGYFTERAKETTTEISAYGFGYSCSGYFNDNWGIYLNFNLNFPTEATVSSRGTSITTTSSDWKSFCIMSAIFGPTYKYVLKNEKCEVFCALGLHLAESLLSTKYANTVNWSYGLGGDLGIRYLSSERFYVSCGLLLFHDFQCSGKIETATSTEKKSGSYNFGSISPYIGLGFRMNSFRKK